MVSINIKLIIRKIGHNRVIKQNNKKRKTAELMHAGQWLTDRSHMCCEKTIALGHRPRRKTSRSSWLNIRRLFVVGVDGRCLLAIGVDGSAVVCGGILPGGAAAGILPEGVAAGILPEGVAAGLMLLDAVVSCVLLLFT